MRMTMKKKILRLNLRVHENEEGDSRGAASRSMMNEVYFYLTDERKYMYQGDDNYKRSLRRKAKNFTVKEGRFFITVYIN